MIIVVLIVGNSISETHVADKKFKTLHISEMSLYFHLYTLHGILDELLKTLKYLLQVFGEVSW